MTQASHRDWASVPARAKGVIEAEVDGEVVIMSPTDFSYFGVTGSGRAIWDRIDGQHSLREVVEALQEAYDGDPEVIERETLDFVGGLEAAGLLCSRAHQRGNTRSDA